MKDWLLAFAEAACILFIVLLAIHVLFRYLQT